MFRCAALVAQSTTTDFSHLHGVRKIEESVVDAEDEASESQAFFTLNKCAGRRAMVSIVCAVRNKWASYRLPQSLKALSDDQIHQTIFGQVYFILRNYFAIPL